MPFAECSASAARKRRLLGLFPSVFAPKASKTKMNQTVSKGFKRAMRPILFYIVYYVDTKVIGLISRFKAISRPM